MTANELRTLFNDKFGIDVEWPKTFEVDAETYGRCCQAIFDHVLENQDVIHRMDDIIFINVSVGPNNGLLFKNVELIISKPPILDDVKCPECGGPMKSRKGQYGTFWGCARFPDCRGTRDSMGRSKADRESEKNKPREPGKWNVT